MAMDAYVSLAKQSIESYLNSGTILEIPRDLPRVILERRAGVFVSLHLKRTHELRGCIGTFEPTQKNIAEEIIHNAVSSAVEDPRFRPLSPDEIENLDINVDVLSEPERVNSTDDLDPKRYGLIVANQHGHRGLLLPDIGVDTVNEQIDICCEKGGIDRERDQLTYYRFTVERHV